MANAFLTGGTGFIGSHLVEALIESGYNVSMLVRPSRDIPCVPSNVRILRGTLFDAYKFGDELENMDYLFLVAGVTKARSVREFYEVNAESVKLWLSVAERHCSNLKRVVLLSSQAAAKPSRIPIKEDDDCAPLTHYGKSKLLGEKYALEFIGRLPITILRPVAVYGPRDRDFFVYFRIVSKGFLPIVGSSERKFSAIFVKDLVDAMIISAVDPNTVNDIFFVKGGDYTLQEFSDAVANAVGKKAVKVKVPGITLWFASFIQEMSALFTRKPPLLSFQKTKELLNWWVADDNKFRRITSFMPKYSLEEGTKITADWYKKNGWI